MSTGYIPGQGDLVWINFDPQIGREQSGRRPAVVLSPASYNGKVGLAILCPITSKIKGYPFESPLPKGLLVSGVVLADQFKSLDWSARSVTFIDRLPTDVLDDILAKSRSLL